MCILVILPYEAFGVSPVDDTQPKQRWSRRALYGAIVFYGVATLTSLVAVEGVIAFWQVLVLATCVGALRVATPATFLIFAVLPTIDAFLSFIRLLQELPALSYGKPPFFLRRPLAWQVFYVARPFSAFCLSIAAILYASALLNACGTVHPEYQGLLFSRPGRGTIESSSDPGPPDLHRASSLTHPAFPGPGRLLLGSDDEVGDTEVGFLTTPTSRNIP